VKKNHFFLREKKHFFSRWEKSHDKPDSDVPRWIGAH
jgi:hypothetical protein